MPTTHDLVPSRDDAGVPAPTTTPAVVRKQLDRIGRYLEVHARRARLAPLPPFADDPMRQADLAALGISPQPPTTRLTAPDLARARSVYEQLWHHAADEPWLERWLLHLIGCGRDPGFTRFWRETLDRRRAGVDGFASERRTYALAALAALAGTHGAAGDTPAHDALRAATRHPLPGVRAAGAAYLLRAYALARQSPPAAAIDVVARLARDDAALEPRYFARMLLEAQRLPQPTEHVAGGYTLACDAEDHREPRRLAVIELRAVHTLAHLHRALGAVLDAPADDGYAFFLRGDYRSGQYEISAADGRGSPPGATALGDLGLRVGHAFYYADGRSPGTTVRLHITALHEFIPPGELLPRVRAAGLEVTGRGAVELLRTHLNGTQHYEAPTARLELKPGDGLVLRREPANSFDDRAVEVLTAGGQKLGYVPRLNNRVLAQLMDAGEALAAELVLSEGRPDWPYLLVTIGASIPGWR